MLVLAITKIFPNRCEPGAAPFNRQQFAELRRFCDVEVLATIPWFPGARWFGKWSKAGRAGDVPEEETIDGLSVRHPRTLFVPRIAPGWSGPLYTASLARELERYRGRASVILGSWAYPDGFAAVRLAERLGIPAVVKLHGSDINVVAKMAAPERRIRATLPRAARIVAVSRQLGDAAVTLGCDRDRVDVIPNGVDTMLFHPRSRSEARRALDLPEQQRVVLFVGRLEKEKGVLDLLDGFRDLPGGAHAALVLVGDGEARAACEARARAAQGDIRVVGARPLAQIPLWLAACDVFCLPSWNEGMPNAVLEALASGRRVVATRVGAIPDLISSETLGELVDRRAPLALCAALARAVRRDYDPAEIARVAGVRSWRESARSLHETLLSALGTADERRARRAPPTFERAA